MNMIPVEIDPHFISWVEIKRGPFTGDSQFIRSEITNLRVSKIFRAMNQK